MFANTLEMLIIISRVLNSYLFLEVEDACKLQDKIKGKYLIFIILMKCLNILIKWDWAQISFVFYKKGIWSVLDKFDFCIIAYKLH